MSFHGTMGTGKNHVTDLIIKHFYKYGEDSKFVHRYRARKDFPIEDEVEIYRVSGLNQFVIPFYGQIIEFSMEVFQCIKNQCLCSIFICGIPFKN